MPQEDLRQNEMMCHLLDALDRGQDIGHYGRLVFAMIARHFMDETELLEQLKKDPSMDEVKAKALVQQVEARDYNPPKAQRILEWQKEQEFPICPNARDSGACNVYKNLRFPDEVYQKIEQFYEQAAESASH